MYVKNSIAKDLCQAEQPYAKAEALKQAWGTWISGLADWQWFATLTLRPPDEEEQARGYTKRGWKYAHNAYDAFLRQVKPALGSLVWFRALELQKWTGVPHIHALVGGLDNTRYAEVASWYWQKYGFCRVLDYDPQLGAGFYLCKYVTKALGDIAFSPGILRGAQRQVQRSAISSKR